MIIRTTVRLYKKHFLTLEITLICVKPSAAHSFHGCHERNKRDQEEGKNTSGRQSGPEQERTHTPEQCTRISC